MGPDTHIAECSSATRGVTVHSGNVPSRKIKAFWYAREPNFGDFLTPLLFSALYGIDLEPATAEEANLFCVGSILDLAPDHYAGHILGTGLMNRGGFRDISKAKVHLLRGKLTKARMNGCPPCPVGEPGLLCSLLAPKVKKIYERGIIPHYMDLEHPEIQHWSQFDRALIIDVRQPPMDTIAQAASCKEIVSSSLHGLVLADALGIPNKWVSLSILKGKTFKFEDYYSVYDRDPIPARTIYKAFNDLDVMDTRDAKADVKRAFDEFVSKEA